MNARTVVTPTTPIVQMNVCHVTCQKIGLRDNSTKLSIPMNLPGSRMPLFRCTESRIDWIVG